MDKHHDGTGGRAISTEVFYRDLNPERVQSHVVLKAGRAGWAIFYVWMLD